MRFDATLVPTGAPYLGCQWYYPEYLFHAYHFSANIKQDATEKHWFLNFRLSDYFNILFISPFYSTAF